MQKLKIISPFLSCAILLGFVVTVQATNRFWDSDGNTNAGLGYAGTFDWLTDTPWTTDANGTSGTITSWVSASDVAIFNGNGAASSTVSANVTCAGFDLVSSPASAINATVNLSGAGSVTLTSPLWVGDYYSPGGCTATLNLSNAVAYSGSGGVVYIGGTGCSGTANLYGPNAVLNGYTVNIGNNGGSGTINVTGGTLNSFGNASIGKSGNGTLNVSGTGLVTVNNYLMCGTVGDSATNNLNGGRMVLGAANKSVSGANTYAVINFNGGVLAGSKSANPWLPAVLDQLNVLGGGAVIDSAGFSIYVFPPLVTGVVGGPDGGLTKLSAGTLLLYGTNTYTGPTLVSAGTLQLSETGVSSSIPDSSLITASPGAVLYVYTVNGNTFTLGSGQTLSGGGAVEGSVRVANSSTAIIHPSGGGTNATTLKMGNPSGALDFLGSSAQAIFDLSSTYNEANDEVTLSNDTLTCGGVQIGINCGSVLDTQDYTLFDVGASGTISGSFNATPVWVGTTPIHAAQYSIIKSGTEYVKLHYTPIPVTITGVTVANKVYDSTTSATFSSGGTVSGLVSPDTTSTVTVVPGTGVFASSSVGTQGVTASGFTLAGADAGYYSLSSQPSGLTATISPYPLTITANDATKTYGQATNFPGTAFTTSGLLGSDSVTGVTLTSAGASASAAAGGYSIIPSSATGSGLGNYGITYANGALTVGQSPLTVSGTGLQGYGATNIILTPTYSGFVLSDDTNVLSGAASLTCAVATNSPVGSYPITVAAGTLSAANYNMSYVDGSLLVTQAVVTVGVIDSSRAYGQTNPVFTPTYSGLMNGESADDTNVMTGAPLITCNALTNSPVGAYCIMVTNGTLSATNYSFGYTNGTLTVVTAIVTPEVTVSDKVYDGTTNATVDTETLDGVVGSDDVSLTGGVASFADKNVGTDEPVTVTGLTLGGATATNYALATNTVITTASINAFPLTVSATGVDKVYDGTTNATVTLSDNRVSGDDLETAYGAAAFPDQNVGMAKPVSVSGITVSGPDSGNYTFNTTASTTASITPLAVTVGAAANTKVYDGTVSAAALPTVTVGSLAGTDSLAFNESYDSAAAGNAKTLTPAGQVNDGNAGNNYNVTLAAAAGVINRAPLTITADSLSRIYGVANRVLTASYNGFVPGEDPSVLSTPPSLGTTADNTSPAGTYPITVSGAAALNYTISYVDGTLTVIALPQLSSIAVAGGQIVLTFPTTLNQNYQIVSTTDLTTGAWTAWGDPIAGTGNAVSVTNGPTGDQMFFRLELQQ